MKHIKHKTMPSLRAKQQRERNLDDLYEECYKLTFNELIQEGQNLGLQYPDNGLDKEQLVYLIACHKFKADISGTYRIKPR